VKRRRKHSSQRTRGHRQNVTVLRVTDVVVSGAKTTGSQIEAGASVIGTNPKMVEKAKAEATKKPAKKAEVGKKPASKAEAAKKPASKAEVAKKPAVKAKVEKVTTTKKKVVKKSAKGQKS
jgi:large subunit ribosomal protein L21